MAAPSERRNGGGASLWAALLLAAAALRPAEAVSEPTTVAFDVRPGGVVHSFSQNVGPGDKYTCAFTYASQGGTNEEAAVLWRYPVSHSRTQRPRLPQLGSDRGPWGTDPIHCSVLLTQGHQQLGRDQVRGPLPCLLRLNLNSQMWTARCRVG
ncbi:myeloid-derived growth factor isoform X2 [Mustela nigripes]|uniref:myeloid-derived growth factor isoform X2 n=1 Tax=Mustela lutreola TaxID=9666 RepID=UPI0027970179|nr:myeloid-derived growth factor isoform X2 [Mustela lutreola]XP_059244682.1 myeloid-derived growth factor isoform X2 [Mustela nigripes]